MCKLTIQIHNPSYHYPIYIGTHIYSSLNTLLEHDYSSILIITDTHVAPLYLNAIKENLPKEKIFTVTIPAGEQSKNFATFYDIQTHLIDKAFDRHSVIVALGGGVVGDLAGFVASTYMRGIDYIQVPTTILAHDSSVGGKVAINHEKGKNLIGSFYHPRMVIYDTATFVSLPFKEIRSGYAELVKEAFIKEEAFLNELLSCPLSSWTYEQMTNHIRKGIEIKTSIVENDEKEKGIRKYLNLGHTLAHALEANFRYHYLNHGEAVAVGLLFSLFVSERVFSVKLPFQPLLSWLRKNGYPLRFERLEVNQLISLMKTDKKTMNHKINMVLLKKIGQPTVQTIEDKDLAAYLNAFFHVLGK